MTNITTAYIDFETYSEAGYIVTPTGIEALPGAAQGKKGLKVVGSAVYVEHPSFAVLTLSYIIKGTLHRWKPGQLPPVKLFAHVRNGGLLSGFNSGGFEVKVWAWLVKHMQWPSVPSTQWRDTMANARAFGLPGKLSEVAKALGTTEQKDKEGTRLINKFCVPQRNGKRIFPESDPLDAENMYLYCDQDVRTEMSIATLIPELSADELSVWQCDRAINDRGVQVDTRSIESCCKIIELAHAKYNVELATLTNNHVKKASELKKLTDWLRADQGVDVESLDAEHLEALLVSANLPKAARRALEIRAAIGSASVKKAFAMRNRTLGSDRLHDLFNYHAARTGRCIAEGQLVLTRDLYGTVCNTPIQDVTIEQEIWDGQEWVTHQGVVPKGIQEVIEHDDVIGTPDHIVFTSTNEYATLQEVLINKCDIFTGELPCPIISIK